MAGLASLTGHLPADVLAEGTYRILGQVIVINIISITIIIFIVGSGSNNNSK